MAGLNGFEMEDDALLFLGTTRWVSSLSSAVLFPSGGFQTGADELIAVELAPHLHRYSSGLVLQLEKD